VVHLGSFPKMRTAKQTLLSALIFQRDALDARVRRCVELGSERPYHGHHLDSDADLDTSGNEKGDPLGRPFLVAMRLEI
jgi:hypothetical protein